MRARLFEKARDYRAAGLEEQAAFIEAVAEDLSSQLCSTLLDLLGRQRMQIEEIRPGMSKKVACEVAGEILRAVRYQGDARVIH